MFACSFIAFSVLLETQKLNCTERCFEQLFNILDCKKEFKDHVWLYILQ